MNKDYLEDNGYHQYKGQDIDVYFNIDICIHAGKCVKGLPSVFNTERKPWILLDGANAEDVKNVIRQCPSGALKYIEKEKE